MSMFAFDGDHPFSPDYRSPITVNVISFDMTFHSVSQFVCWTKAILANDYSIAKRITHEGNPSNCRTLAKRLRPNGWLDGPDSPVERTLRRASMLKFSGTDLEDLLMGVEETLIVNSHDDEWSCGLDTTQVSSCCVEDWPMDNLLGFALMHTRATIATMDYGCA